MQNGRGVKPIFWLSVTISHSKWGSISLFSLPCSGNNMHAYSQTSEALLMSPCQDVSQGPRKLARKPVLVLG